MRDIYSAVCEYIFCFSVSHAEDTVSSVEAAQKALGENSQNISISRERSTFLMKQVERLKKDQRALSDALIKTAKGERAIANDIAEREAKLKKMVEKQTKVHQVLKSRRAEFAKVLALLERMGLKPPPALIVRPEDVLVSVRSSVLLGALVSQMQEKHEI